MRTINKIEGNVEQIPLWRITLSDKKGLWQSII